MSAGKERHCARPSRAILLRTVSLLTLLMKRSLYQEIRVNRGGKGKEKKKKRKTLLFILPLLFPRKIVESLRNFQPVLALPVEIQNIIFSFSLNEQVKYRYTIQLKSTREHFQYDSHTRRDVLKVLSDILVIIAVYVITAVEISLFGTGA